jgi:hypothetical protein
MGLWLFLCYVIHSLKQGLCTRYAGSIKSIHQAFFHMEGRLYLSIRQQPVRARSCGFGARDFRPIDPAPVLQVFVERSGVAETPV